MTEFADALVDESGAHYQTAGSLRELLADLPDHEAAPAHDAGRPEWRSGCHGWYLALFSHDGSSSLFGITTSVRVVCANTASVAIAGAKSKFSIPHTSGWKGATQVAREKLVWRSSTRKPLRPKRGRCSPSRSRWTRPGVQRGTGRVDQG